MRFAFRINSTSIAICLALCAVVALIALPAGARAQETAQAQSATLTESADTSMPTTVATAPALTASRDTTTATTATTAAVGQLAGSVLSVPADGASVNDISLDDQMLSRQRGGALGMVMVAATPQLTHGNGASVTLWDEIAPPSPLPVPVDAARAAQGNVAMYQRK
jgi:hypothetical protein